MLIETQNTPDPEVINFFPPVKILKSGRAEFAIETVYNISAEAQTIEFAIESNIDYTYEIGEDAQDWIEAAVDSKAAPVESTLKFDVEENPVSTPREGHVYIEAGDAIYSLVVTQAGGVEELATAAVTYLGNTMKIYDNGFKSNFVENFNEQLKFKDVTSDDLKMMNSPVNYNELCKLAMAYSDGVVMNGENIDTELIEYAKSLNIPVVENQQGFDAYADACNSLYDKVLGDNE